MPVTEGTVVTADSVRLYYRIAGERGPVVMAPFALFHGVRFDGLAAPGFRVVTYDPRGRGRSAPVTPDRVSLSQLHSDFDAVGRAVGVDAVAAIGWSGAGMELFVLTNPPLLHHPVAANELPDVCVFPNEYPPALQRYFGALFRHIAGFDWRDSLSAVAIPRLVLHGASDNTPLTGNREWVDGQANARLQVIDGAGHWPHYEQPGVTLDAIISFLREAVPSEPPAGTRR